MKRILAIAALAFSVQLCNAMSTVTLPDAQILTQRLNAAGFEEIVQQTVIISQLAGKRKNALAINIAADIYFVSRYKNIDNAGTAVLIQARKQQLIATILADHPALIAELKTMLPPQ